LFGECDRGVKLTSENVYTRYYLKLDALVFIVERNFETKKKKNKVILIIFVSVPANRTRNRVAVSLSLAPVK
jgi:hypothetical protein